jgi:hypothetical protein
MPTDRQPDGADPVRNGPMRSSTMVSASSATATVTTCACSHGPANGWGAQLPAIAAALRALPGPPLRRVLADEYLLRAVRGSRHRGCLLPRPCTRAISRPTCRWCACCSPCTVLQTTVPPAGELSESAAEPRAARPMSEGRPMVHAARRPSSRRTAAALGAGVEPVRHTQSGTEFPKYRGYRARRRSANVTISVIGSSGDDSKPRAR